jgi:hypothetical protein
VLSLFNLLSANTVDAANPVCCLLEQRVRKQKFLPPSFTDTKQGRAFKVVALAAQKELDTIESSLKDYV